MRIKAWMDYNKVDKVLEEAIYFKRPTTRHTNSDIVSVEVEITIKKFMKPKISPPSLHPHSYKIQK